MIPDSVKRIGSLIEFLERVRLTPHMYMVRHDADLAVVFLRGVELTAERLLGICTSGEIRWRVWDEHGWGDGGARGPVAHMQREGLDDEAIVDELIAMEIDVLKRAAALHTESK